MARPKNAQFPVVLQVRISEEMETDLQAYVEARKRREPGLQFGMADAHRILLGRALATEKETGELADKPRRK